MNKKKVIIVLIIVLLLGVLIYSLFVIPKISDDKESSTIMTTTIKNTTKKSETFDSFPENDASVKIIEHAYLTEDELKTDFKNLEKEENGVKYSFDCTLFEYVDIANFKGDYCTEFNVNINGTLIKDEMNFREYNYGRKYYITNDLIVVYITDEYIGTGQIDIYKGQRKIWNSFLFGDINMGDNIYYIGIDKNGVYYYPTINQNKLYFILITGASNTKDNLEYGYIDLTKDQYWFHSIKKYTGSYGGIN